MASESEVVVMLRNDEPHLTAAERKKVVDARASQLQDNEPTFLPDLVRRIGDEADVALKELHAGFLGDFLVNRRYPSEPDGTPRMYSIRVSELKLKQNY